MFGNNLSSEGPIEFIYGLFAMIVFIGVMFFVVSWQEWEKEGMLAYGHTEDGAEYRAFINGKIIFEWSDGKREIVYFSLDGGVILEYDIFKGGANVVYNQWTRKISPDWDGKVLDKKEALKMAYNRYGPLIEELLPKLHKKLGIKTSTTHNQMGCFVFRP